MHGQDDQDVDQGQNDDRDACLGKNGGEVGNRQRLPEQDRAIATLIVQGAEAIEDADDEGRENDCGCCEVIGLDDRSGFFILC